ncbi:MAG: MATE family efflux transporter [Clostridia bacterium]|nr:MATE family efflux transporter [Clostridia bacterium]
MAGKAAQRAVGSGTVDLTQGPLFKNIIKFTVPVILTGILQLLFNAADIVVIGRYGSDTALAAVSATGALINLIVNLLVGLSVGAGVCVARCFGSRDDRGQHEVVHTSMLVAGVGGVVFGLIGFFFARIFLVWMSTPDNVIDQASTYVRIYFIGVPFSIVYNFGAAILRSVGNTKRPLLFLVIAGVINVAFNLVFVIVLNMDVAGVAWATAISQFVSCILVVAHLLRVKGAHRLQISKLRIYGDKLKQVLVVGLPAGIQGSLFSISNVLIQSSVNGFGDIAMSGNGVAANIEGFVYTSMNSFHQTALNFTGQHVGAKKQDRIKLITGICVACVSVVGLVMGVGAFLLGKPLIGIYEPGRDDVAAYGIMRMSIISTTYFICGIMDVFSGTLRGMGKSISSMIITLLCVCGIRVVWIYTVFEANKTLTTLYLSYPISWAICVVAQLILFIFAYKQMIKRARISEMLSAEVRGEPDDKKVE